MGKQYHFLAGLHRSGNTVLSSILNQNPETYSSPISSLVEHMWVCHSTIQNFESSRVSSEDKQRSINMVSKMTERYYEDIDKPIVFDRSKAWANPANINMIKTYVSKKSKIIFTTRPILQCVASLIAIDKETMIMNMLNSNFVLNPKLKENENLADFLFSDYSNPELIRKYFIDSIDNPDNAGMIHVVKYEDLLSTPQETMDNIYNFLELESFKHNFKNIRKLEEYDDAAAGLAKDLHKVRRVLGKGDVRIEEYLTPYTIEKYKDLRYF